MDSQLKYNSGIKTILEKLDSNLSINNKAVVLLNGLLNGINGKLVNHCRTKFKEEGYIQGTSSNPAAVALDAVQTVFPGELKNNAKAEGHRCLILFYNGLLNYSSISSTTDSNVIFGSGIRKLGNVAFPDAKLEQKAIKKISEFLDNLCTMAAQKSAESESPENKIEVRDIKETLKSILPKELQNHANSEGNRKILEHALELFVFIPALGTSQRKVLPILKKPPRKRNAVSSTSNTSSKTSTPSKRVASSKPAELPKKPISFSNGIKQVSKEVNDRLKLSRSAVTFLDYIANEVNYKLIDYCNHSTENLPENSAVYLTVAEDAVKAIYPGDLVHHAVAEANKDVFLLQNGIMTYNPRKRKEPITQKKLTQRTMFPKGLQSLVRTTVPDAELHAKSRTFIANILQNLFMKICREANLFMENQNKLQHSDINLILENVLPKEMRQHAHAEAAQALQKYEMGIVSFMKRGIKRKKA